MILYFLILTVQLFQVTFSTNVILHLVQLLYSKDRKTKKLWFLPFLCILGPI